MCTYFFLSGTAPMFFKSDRCQKKSLWNLSTYSQLRSKKANKKVTRYAIQDKRYSPGRRFMADGNLASAMGGQPRKWWNPVKKNYNKQKNNRYEDYFIEEGTPSVVTCGAKIPPDSLRWRSESDGWSRVKHLAQIGSGLELLMLKQRGREKERERDEKKEREMNRLTSQLVWLMLWRLMRITRSLRSTQTNKIEG